MCFSFGFLEYLGFFSSLPFIHGGLSLNCSALVFCALIVVQLFKPNLPLFPTTNQCLALFVCRPNQLSLSYSRSQPPCHIVLSFSLCLSPSASCYLWRPKLWWSRAGQDRRYATQSLPGASGLLPHHSVLYGNPTCSTFSGEDQSIH